MHPPLFNRNILYCKCSSLELLGNGIGNLIETFCIVNIIIKIITSLVKGDLIETFCIVNNYEISYHKNREKFNRNILYCKFQAVGKF